MLDLLNFADQLAGADVVVLGEGCLDNQTLAGKGPAVVARMARERGIPVVAVAGTIRLSRQELRSAGITAGYDLLSRAGDTESSVRDAARLLEEIGAELGRAWAQGAGESDGSGAAAARPFRVTKHAATR